MKEIVKEIVTKLFNPKVKEQKKLDIKNEYETKFNKSIYLRDYLKTKAWQEFHRPIIYGSLENGMSKLLRDGLTMSETELKAIIADMRANLNLVIETKFAIENGEEAGMKLEKLG